MKTVLMVLRKERWKKELSKNILKICHLQKGYLRVEWEHVWYRIKEPWEKKLKNKSSKHLASLLWQNNPVPTNFESRTKDPNTSGCFTEVCTDQWVLFKTKICSLLWALTLTATDWMSQEMPRVWQREKEKPIKDCLWSTVTSLALLP